MSTEHWNKGVAAIGARDTEHDTPSQRRYPGMFAATENITSVVHSIDPALDVPSIYGGAIPDHSSHWRDYFAGGWAAFPLTARPTPDAINVAVAVAEPQNEATASGHDPWSWFQRLVQGPMRNGMASGSITK